MDTLSVSAAGAATLGALAEGHFLDRKSARIAPRKLTRTLSAFANADGGDLYVGIEDDGTWAGVADPEEFNGHLQALEALFPYGAEFDYRFLQHEDDGTVVLHVQVQKTRSAKVASDDKTYVRRGAGKTFPQMSLF